MDLKCSKNEPKIALKETWNGPEMVIKMVTNMTEIIRSLKTLLDTLCDMFWEISAWMPAVTSYSDFCVNPGEAFLFALRRS